MRLWSLHYRITILLNGKSSFAIFQFVEFEREVEYIITLTNRLSFKIVYCSKDILLPLLLEENKSLLVIANIGYFSTGFVSSR